MKFPLEILWKRAKLQISIENFVRNFPNFSEIENFHRKFCPKFRIFLYCTNLLFISILMSLFWWVSHTKQRQAPSSPHFFGKIKEKHYNLHYWNWKKVKPSIVLSSFYNMQQLIREQFLMQSVGSGNCCAWYCYLQLAGHHEWTYNTNDSVAPISYIRHVHK